MPTFVPPVSRSTGYLVTAAVWDSDVVTNTLALEAAKANLLINGGFEIWQRGAGTFSANNAYSADGWKIILGGTSSLNVDREGTTIDSGSQWSAKVTYTHGTATSALRQTVPIVLQARTRTLAWSMRVRSSTANAVRLKVTDGTNTWTSAFHTGGGTFETLTVATAAIASGASTVNLDVSFEAGTAQAHYLDNSACTFSPAQPDFYPLPDWEEMQRCQRWYEVIGPGSAGISIGGIATAASQQAYMSLRFVPKPATPTVTKNGTWTTSNTTGQPTVGNADTDSLVVTITSNAAGQFYAHNGAAGCTITVDASP